MGKLFTFKKEERLCSKKQINSLFEQGRWLRSEHLRLVYLISEEELTYPAKVMFTVPKKIHRKAVTRNLIKRKLRESYRLNKPFFYDQLNETNKQLIIAVVYSNHKVVKYESIRQEIKLLLLQVATRVSKV